jgi:hypothetical protein
MRQIFQKVSGREIEQVTGETQNSCHMHKRQIIEALYANACYCIVLYTWIMLLAIVYYCVIDTVILYYIILCVLCNNADAQPLLSELEKVCKSCLVPSLPGNRKDTNVRIAYRTMWMHISCPASWKQFEKAA